MQKNDVPSVKRAEQKNDVLSVRRAVRKNDILSVRRAVDANIGRRVRVRANKGRHKYVVAEGVLLQSYPSIFTIRLDATGDLHERLVSYSYIDILTKDVQLVLCSRSV